MYVLIKHSNINNGGWESNTDRAKSCACCITFLLCDAIPFILCCCISLRLIVIEKSPLFSAFAYFLFTFNGKIDSILQVEREREKCFEKNAVRHQTRDSRFYDKQHNPKGVFFRKSSIKLIQFCYRTSMKTSRRNPCAIWPFSVIRSCVIFMQITNSWLKLASHWLLLQINRFWCQVLPGIRCAHISKHIPAVGTTTNRCFIYDMHGNLPNRIPVVYRHVTAVDESIKCTLSHMGFKWLNTD